MVRNYFYEMAFVIYELARVLKSGGAVAMVNDNVRYAGQEVPVDLILGDLAEQFGLRVRHIWTLGRGKGNSSQQMGNHGRTELRKCVYIWEKPYKGNRCAGSGKAMAKKKSKPTKGARSQKAVKPADLAAALTESYSARAKLFHTRVAQEGLDRLFAEVEALSADLVQWDLASLGISPAAFDRLRALKSHLTKCSFTQTWYRDIRI